MHAREDKIDLGNRQSGSDFARRHIGPNETETAEMLREVGFENLDALIDATVPKNIRLDRELNLPKAKSEAEALAELRAISKKNKIAKSFIGAGNSAKRSRESRLVHGLHTLSSRARAGASRSVAQFPNDDCRSYQARHCQRVDARRSDLCGGSNDALSRRRS